MIKTRIGFVLGLGILGVGCDSADEAQDVGAARLAVLNAPADATCLRVTVAGGRTVVKNLSLTPGQSTVFSLNKLPVGNSQWSADAFALNCAVITAADVPRWIADPVAVNVPIGAVADVVLALKRNGLAKVTADFEVEADAGAPPTDGP